ncbi:hypothetical protein CBR_g51224 [Chara braunii]|uniref:Reverse transcriptase/retrotransposon-derived protein RNase H-like domain-containing protein n=1 Tax=Chara braunii TaxID=69332 RepID=A0A388M882_CHABU|nr:hypothetical protein CBR_g51224 [Chara braunii]|eukprot:GBG90715.1 hypothetical protein CBR_g51224 [Chara braunii]
MHVLARGDRHRYKPALRHLVTLRRHNDSLKELGVIVGYIVTRGGLWPDSRKVVAVREAPVPTSLTQVRAFLGLASYYRRFIKGFAAIARPLTNVLRKDQRLSWDAEGEAFATLEDALVMAPILIRPDPSKRFILITDWQPKAISTILAQKGNDGREHVIEYASRMVSDERRNDSAPQGECYWSACLEAPESSRNPPSQRGYLDPHEIVDLAFFQYRTASENEEVEIEAEEESSEEEEEVEEEADEEETPEEGSYSEHSEGEQSEEEEEEEEQDDEEEKEEDQEELEESEWEGFEEEVRDDARAQA